MDVQGVEPLVRALRAALGSGALARQERIILGDGVAVDPERMARIVLAD